MEIYENEQTDTVQGPAEWFTGTVWIETITRQPEPSRLRALRVMFNPGARTAWHTHPNGQTLHVTQGTARVQSQGEPVREAGPGSTIYFAPGEKHWHGAAPDRPMTHLALQQAGEDGSEADWGEHVSDADYGAP